MKSGNLIIVGLSVFYIVIILFFRGNDAWNLLRTGELNELGDFLAGFFTPLAFGWLVYGYILQSRELSLQRKELSLTRDQLGKQTELLQEQVTAETRPHLALRVVSNPGGWAWIVENKGGTARDIELWDSNEKQMLNKTNSLPRNESFQFTATGLTSSHLYEARFSSESSQRFRQCWEIKGNTYREITSGPEPLATEDENSHNE